MKSLAKVIPLMGGRHTIGGVAIMPNHLLAICYNSVNRLVIYDLKTDTIVSSMQALSFADYCETVSLTYINHPSQPEGFCFLLANGEVWHKALSTGAETRWGVTQVPECKGASAIEYWNGSLYAAFEKDNKIRSLVLGSLNTITVYSTGIRGGSVNPAPYAPVALSYDGIIGAFVAIDPVKGEMLWMNTSDFTESAYERYIYHVYNNFFRGDLAMSRELFPAFNAGYFIIAEGTSLAMYTDAWYKLYEVDDLSGQTTEVNAMTFNDTPAGQELVKHYRLQNVTNILRSAVTITVANDLEHNVDETLTLSSTGQAGSWARQTAVGDIAGMTHKDFWVRFFPQTTTEIGTFAVEIVVDYV